MLFPQGFFSVGSLARLKAHGYLAAVNTSPVPVGPADVPCLRDVLAPAMTKYLGFPVFLRHYPAGGLACVALDAFLGKPLFFGEHHAYFRNGYDDFKNLVANIRAIEPGVIWGNLRQTIENSFLRRVDAEGLNYIKIFSHAACIENEQDQTLSVSVYKKEAAAIDIAGVTVDQRPIKYSFIDGYLRISFEILPKRKSQVKITYTKTPYMEPYRIPFSSDLRSALRRHLSEFRDNHIQTSGILSRIFK
jgi:hypothetical protein